MDPLDITTLFANPAFGALLQQNPDMAATHLAASGVAPPAPGQSLFDQLAPVGQNSPFNVSNWFSGAQGQTPAVPQTVNTAVPDILAPVAPSGAPAPQPGAPVPMPTPRPQPSGATSTVDPGASADGKTMSQKLAESMKTLSGVKAPQQPAAQKINSPHVPTTNMNTPGAGALAALLTQATQGQQNTTSPVLRLAQALSGR